jgi:hypothetical protein
MENGIIQLNLMKKSKFTYVILLQLLSPTLLRKWLKQGLRWPILGLRRGIEVAVISVG